MKKNIATFILLSILTTTTLAFQPKQMRSSMPGAAPPTSPQELRNAADTLKIWIEFVEQMSSPQEPVSLAYMTGLGAVTPLHVSSAHRTYVDALKQRQQTLEQSAARAEQETQWWEEFHQSARPEPIDSFTNEH